MTTLDGIAAIEWMRAKGTNQVGMCLYTVYLALGSPVTTGPGAGHYAQAIDGWDYAVDKHPGDMNAPAGSLVYLGPSPTRTDANAGAGDVAISLGGGQIIATDFPYAGVIGTCTIAEREAQTQRPYLGWAGDYGGHPISYAHEGLNLTHATTDPEEDDMAKLKGATYQSGGKAVFLLFNEESGFYAQHSGVDGKYNNPIAQDWETGSWPTITEAHAKVIIAALDKVRTASK